MSEFISVEGFDRSNWEEGTDAYPKDSLNRRELAEFYTSFLVGKGVSSNTGYVLNIDSGWGTGKTYFLQQWRKSIEKSYPTIYIDAWKQDYSDDPIITIFASIMNQLSSLDRNQTTKAKAIISSVASFSKAAGPVLLKGLIKKATGINTDEITDKISKNDGDGVLADAAGAIAQSLIADHNNKLVAIDELRESIASLVESVVAYDEKLNRPAFIFVDELDRCRPSYAVELLEVIKHFFATKGVVFVVATDTHQLQHTIKGLYGMGFDAETYLIRFFNRRAVLNAPKRIDFILNNLHGKELTEDVLLHVHFPACDSTRDVSDLIAAFADLLELSLRDIEQLCDQIKSVLWLKAESFDLLMYIFIYTLYRWFPDRYKLFFGNYTDALELKDNSEKSRLFNSLLDLNFYCSLGVQYNGFFDVHQFLNSFPQSAKMRCYINTEPKWNIDKRGNISLREIVSKYSERYESDGSLVSKHNLVERTMIRDITLLNARLHTNKIKNYFDLVETSALLTQI